ncbi:MAG: DUF5320 domain-containing protein [Syntrophales bacterium]|nr:DUF5320 domain-containing protein [Syntrophales bacterium]
MANSLERDVFAMPGYANPVPGRNYGMGFGRERGTRGRGFGGAGFRWRDMVTAGVFPGWGSFGRYAAPYGHAAPYQEPEPEMEKQALRNQADVLQVELESIRKRLAELEAGNATD